MKYVLPVLVALAVGLVGGFFGYKLAAKLTGHVTIPSSELESLNAQAGKTAELEKQLQALKAREGRAPSGHRFSLSSAIVRHRPQGIINQIRIGQQFFLVSQWSGVQAKRVYEQVWQLWNGEQLVAEDRFPFVPTEDGEYWSWAAFQLTQGTHAPGQYRLHVLLNGRTVVDRPVPVIAN